MFERPKPNGQERFFDRDEIIVSKTDLKGRMTYVNRVFCRVAGYTEAELLGKPHNIIRHPDMPRGAFKLLWNQIQSGHEIFAYVKNLCKDGSHYWVLAHVTPTFNDSGQIISYHSNRRVPSRKAITAVEKVYQATLSVEYGFSNPKKAAEAGLQFLIDQVAESGFSSYDEFVFSIINQRRAA